ncbi:MAG: metalloregulator ArsR/SmtB family transcription factor [Parcubacteria group bacterium]
MNKKKLWRTSVAKNNDTKNARRTYLRPSWVPRIISNEEELCPDCFKVVGERSRYNLVCMLGKSKEGMTVGALTEKMKLRQPTVTHHLQVLHSVNAVEMEPHGRERVYKLNRDAHCFEECKIPY